ncbi:MAG: hypothetical protein IT368_11640 [Candidatus Hydrogenedentes bacterium]|nr:hypothetical protein [Candidatus Hydrogenedentota bacterium]
MRVGRNAIAMLLIMAASGAMAQDRPQDRQPITNYWRHILDVIDEQKARQEQLEGTENMVNPPPREYVFDAFAHLSTHDLMRAVKEGIEAAQRETFRKPDAVVKQAIQQNILSALEYYPIVAQDRKDFNPLLYAIENSLDHPQLRLFIIRRLVPGETAPSLFTTYLQQQVAEDPGEIRGALGKITQRPSEDPEVFLAATDALFAIYKDEYQARLNQIEAVHALAGDQPPALALLQDGAMNGLPDEAKIKVAEQGVAFNDLVDRMKAILDPFAGYPPGNRIAARKVLERIYNEIPLENRSQIKATLDQYPEEELKKPLDRLQLVPAVPTQNIAGPDQPLKPYDPNDPSTWPVVEGEANAEMFAPPPGTKLPPTRR